MKQIYISAQPEETRAAVVTDGQLQAVEMERSAHSHLVGNIYKGQVQNVLKGMQAAFVDIGMEKNAFLYVGDGMPQDVRHVLPQKTKVYIGEYLPVQITKDAVGTKGPRATTHITIPGRNVVLLPTAAYIGISRRIEEETERARLQAVAERHVPAGMGLILRTASEGVSEEELAKEIDYLAKIWQGIRARFALKSRGATLLYRDADLLVRAIRDHLDDTVDQVAVEGRQAFSRVRELVRTMLPAAECSVTLYEDRTPLFQQYGIEKEIVTLGARRVELPSGGFLVIDKTEALTAIDVNTGKYTGRDNLAETAYRTNLEAAGEVMKQIRLRDIGGMILVDFIDMERETQKEDLLARLRHLARLDRTKTNVVDITRLGLVEITRKKTRENLDSIVYTDCPVCHGLGRVESPETVSIRISRDIRRMERKSHAQDGYEVEVHESVAEELRQNQLMMNLAAEFGTDIKVTTVPGMHPENYTILQQL